MAENKAPLNLFSMFQKQIELLDKAIIKKLKGGDMDGIGELVEAEIKLAEYYEILEEPPQDWPEGASTDNPEEELPEERKKRELMKDRGFYS